MEGLWPDLDVALLPIAGWGLTLPEGEHMGPLQAARALRLLRPRLAVPVHWGTFGLPGTGLGRRGREAAAAAPAAFRRHARELAPEVAVTLLRPGETLGSPKRWRTRPPNVSTAAGRAPQALAPPEA